MPPRPRLAPPVVGVFHNYAHTRSFRKAGRNVCSDTLSVRLHVEMDSRHPSLSKSSKGLLLEVPALGLIGRTSSNK
jgi:hypothetical protein